MRHGHHQSQSDNISETPNASLYDKNLKSIQKLDGDLLIITAKDSMEIHSVIHLTQILGNFKYLMVLKKASQRTEL